MTAKKTKIERREEILEAAVSCFAEKGYYETTMDDIVRRSGLSKGALYWHFENKKALFRSLVELWQADYAPTLEQLDGRQSAREKLHILKEGVKRSVAIRPDLIRAQLEFYSLAVRDDEYREWLGAVYREQMQFLQSVIEEGIERGEFRKFDAERLCRMLAAYTDGLMLQREIHEHAASPAAILDECMDTFLELVEAPSHG